MKKSSKIKIVAKKEQKSLPSQKLEKDFSVMNENKVKGKPRRKAKKITILPDPKFNSSFI